MKPRLIFCALLLLALAACKRDAAAMEVEPAAPVAADPVTQAPAVTAATVEIPALAMQDVEGKPFDLAAHRGQWVVVNFWATWCAPCIKEMPELSELDARRDDVQVVGLAYEEIEAQAMRDFLKTRPVVYPIVLLDVYNPPADFATPRGLPMTYLLNPEGKVAKQFLGPVTAHEIEAAIAAAGGAGKA